MLKALQLEPEKCTGCLQCEMACSFENEGIFNPSKSRIKVFTFHEEGRFAPYTCSQCAEAWCMHACPVEAIVLNPDTGSKDVLEDVCVGCKVCTIACPFGTVNYNADSGKVIKCDLCGGEPACAEACPTDAITYVDADHTGLERMRAHAAQTIPAIRSLEAIMAWTKKILRVNLNAGTCTDEPLNMEWAAKYLGQRGLASKYLAEEIDPACDALSPENKLIMATGPLTGTMASTAGRYSVITKSPLTGAIACSNSGGFIGNEIKNAGYDMIIFEGKSPQPVYLHLENDKATLCPADEIWGKSVWEADEILHTKYQDPLLRISAVGRAAEQGCLYSAIVNDLHRAAGRSGVGTVMASKNLKAVAVRGTLGVGNIRDPKEFVNATNEGKRVLAENAMTGEGLAALGTQALMNVINEVGAMPTRNMREVQFEGASKISGEAMLDPRESDGKPNLTTNGACFGCTIACGRISTIDPQHYTIADKPQYAGNSGGLEYEAAWALGSDTGIDDLDALTYANFLCNEDGYDPISFGATVAAAMELFEIGAITTKETGGLELKFGSAEALTKAAELVATGEGFGKDLGLGSKRLCEKYGHPELSMTVKGQEFPAYDPRGIQGMGLAYAASNRGACHLRGYTVSSELLGVPVKTDPLSTEGKPDLVKAFQDATAAVDSSGLCVFTTFAWTLEDIAPQVAAACEGNWSAADMVEAGERIWNLERKFNMDAGLTAADDTLPERLLKDAAKTGPAKGKVNELDKMLPEYYEVRGWTADGVPTSETLERLSV